MAVRTRFGLQVDAWGALVMEKAELAEEVEKLTIEYVKDRELEGLAIAKGSVDLGGGSREYVAIEQNMGGGGRAAALLRIASRGKDLDISWRLFEKNVTKSVVWGMSQGTLLVLGTLTSIVGLGVLPLYGAGLCLLIPGIVMIGASFGWWRVGRSKTTASTVEQFESRALAQMVHWSLMKAMASNGISSAQVQVLQQANTSGLAKLMPTDLVDELTDKPKLGT
jgi:hypothetical protein